MFDNLSERLQGTFKKLRGQSRITEENITQALRDVRMALIEADVALPVVKEVVETIKNAAVGQEVSLKLSPDQAFIKTVKSELVRIMGEENSALNLAAQPPAVILMAGLQGSGKTTSSAKLARKLINEKKKVALVSADVYRPAAIEQLKTLAEQVGATFIPDKDHDYEFVLLTTMRGSLSSQCAVQAYDVTGGQSTPIAISEARSCH